MTQFNRADEDIGNIVSLEHVNVQVPDQRLATQFYMSGLGLTRDPYQQTGITNIWVNAGRCQFHLPTGEPQVLGGHTVLVLPTRAGLLRRLARVAKVLEGTRFGFTEMGDHVAVTCPWGNQFRCVEPDSGAFGRMRLGIPIVSIDVAPGAAAGIARFYQEIFQAPAEVAQGATGAEARVRIGKDQQLVFAERADGAKRIAAYDGHHVAVYLLNFSGPHRRLIERGLISRESNQHEYRFIDITDLASGTVLAKLEHEVRSMRHPQYARPLVNRDPDATGFVADHESYAWSTPSG